MTKCEKCGHKTIMWEVQAQVLRATTCLNCKHMWQVWSYFTNMTTCDMFHFIWQVCTCKGKGERSKMCSNVLTLNSLIIRVDLLAGTRPVARVMPHSAHLTSTPGSESKTQDELNSQHWLQLHFHRGQHSKLGDKDFPCGTSRYMDFSPQKQKNSNYI